MFKHDSLLLCIFSYKNMSTIPQQPVQFLQLLSKISLNIWTPVKIDHKHRQTKFQLRILIFWIHAKNSKVAPSYFRSKRQWTAFQSELLAKRTLFWHLHLYSDFKKSESMVRINGLPHRNTELERFFLSKYRKVFSMRFDSRPISIKNCMEASGFPGSEPGLFVIQSFWDFGHLIFCVNFFFSQVDLLKNKGTSDTNDPSIFCRFR